MTSFQPLQPPDAVVACPFLGGGDVGETPRSRLVPSAAHVCLAGDGPAPVSLPHQTVFCLGGRAASCSRFRGTAAPAAGAAPAPAVPAREPRRLDTRLAIAALVIAAGVGLAASLLAVGNPFDAEPAPSGLSAAAPASPGAAPATPAPASQTPAITATAAAPTATAAPSPMPTPAPTATPVVYTVQPGDSLTRLARRFGLSVAALAAANGLPANAELRVGQTLTIPATIVSATPTPP